MLYNLQKKYTEGHVYYRSAITLTTCIMSVKSVCYLWTLSLTAVQRIKLLHILVMRCFIGSDYTAHVFHINHTMRFNGIIFT